MSDIDKVRDELALRLPRRGGVVDMALAETIEALVRAIIADPPVSHVGRCAVTGNPVGTDTWSVGYSCPCAMCQAWLKESARTIIADPIPKDGVPDEPPKCTCGAMDALDHSRECVAEWECWKKSYRAGLKERLAVAEARIADLERERDDLLHDLSETRRSSSDGTMMFARKSERLEDEVDQLRKAAAVGQHILENALKQTRWSFALAEVHEAIRILTAALQPEPQKNSTGEFVRVA